MEFYYVDSKYIEYLKQYEPSIPDMSYNTRDKFVCGVLLQINNINYYAPISSNTYHFRTSFVIKNKNEKPISSIRFSFMFPVPASSLKMLDFKELAKSDKRYTSLVDEEYRYCKTNESKIRSAAIATYQIGTNKKHVLNHTCNDFKKLEQAYLRYVNQTTEYGI